MLARKTVVTRHSSALDIGLRTCKIQNCKTEISGSLAPKSVNVVVIQPELTHAASYNVLLKWVHDSYELHINGFQLGTLRKHLNKSLANHITVDETLLPNSHLNHRVISPLPIKNICSQTHDSRQNSVGKYIHQWQSPRKCTCGSSYSEQTQSSTVMRWEALLEATLQPSVTFWSYTKDFSVNCSSFCFVVRAEKPL